MKLLRNTLVFLVIASTAMLSGFLILSWVPSRKAEIDRAENLRLPADVVQIIKGFNYYENGKSFQVNINGKEAVLRGKKIMVFRSNLVKSTVLTDLNGSITSNKHNFTFKAQEGDWNTNKDSPFTLSHNVNLQIDGKLVPNVKSVEIYFNRQTVAVKAVTNITYSY